MTTQDTDPEALTPAQMAQLRAEFQRMGMTPAQAAEGAAILASLGGKLDLLRADTRGALATVDRILARIAIIAKERRRPRA
jgi:hypothetical protein